MLYYTILYYTILYYKSQFPLIAKTNARHLSLAASFVSI